MLKCVASPPEAPGSATAAWVRMSGKGMNEDALCFAKTFIRSGQHALPRMQDMQPTICLFPGQILPDTSLKESDMKATLDRSYPPFSITTTLKRLCSRTRWLGLCVTYPKADSTPTIVKHVPLRPRLHSFLCKIWFSKFPFQLLCLKIPFPRLQLPGRDAAAEQSGLACA